MTRLRVGLAIETDGPGGAETMLLELAEELRFRGHYVLAIGPEQGEGWLSRRFAEHGFDRETLDLQGPFDPGSVLRLRSIIRSAQLDLLHSHEFTLAVIGALAARAAGRPHVFTMHGGLYYSEHRRRRLAVRAAMLLSDHTVAVSQFGREVLSGHLSVGPEKIDVVYNGVAPCPGRRTPVRDELALGDEDVLILAVGNLYPVKGHRFLVSALAELPRDRRIVAAIAGRGDEHDALAAQARAEGVGESLHLLGFRADVPDLLAAADVFVMPSVSEGMPMAVIEAMLASKPVVASRVGGMPELVTEGEQGFLVAAGEPAELASALARLVSDAAVRDRMGASARLRAEREFSASAMAGNYESLYRRALAGQQPHAHGRGLD